MAVNLEIVRGLVEPKGWLGEQHQVQAVGPYALPMEWRIEFEERAAILEYDGGLSRRAAETQALREINERIKKNLKF